MAQDLELSSSSKLTAVASRSRVRAENFASKYQVDRVYEDYKSLCADPALDLIYIATPHAFHFEHSMLALRHGKAVLCEKPMALNAEELRRLINYAQKEKRFLMEGLWTRFIPATQKVIELIEQDTIGAIQKIEAEFSFKAPYDPQSRLFNPKLGGGALLDIGIYPLYLALLLIGTPENLKAQFERGETGVDLATELKLKYPSGAEAQLKASFLENKPVVATIEGQKGRIRMHARFHHCAALQIEKDDQQEELAIPFEGLGYYHEIKEVEKCLGKGLLESPKHSLADSLQIAEQLDWALKQMPTQQ